MRYVELAPPYAWVRNHDSGTYHIYHAVDHRVRCDLVLRAGHQRHPAQAIHASHACKRCLRGADVRQFEAELGVSVRYTHTLASEDTHG